MEGMKSMADQIGRLNLMLDRIDQKFTDGGKTVVELSLEVRGLSERVEDLETTRRH